MRIENCSKENAEKELVTSENFCIENVGFSSFSPPYEKQNLKCEYPDIRNSLFISNYKK